MRTADRRLPQSLPDLGQHGGLVGKLSGLELRVDQFPTDGQFKASATLRDQRQILDALLVLGQEFGRQTDSLWLVVSHRAVFKLHVH